MGTEFLSEDKADYAISVGPQHPTHKEPVRFIFHIKGETIEDVDLRLGFNHRGIEKAFEARTWNQNLYLAERLCGICSNVHQFTYVQAAEKCAGVYDEVPERAKYIRVIMEELERIHSHILWYGVLAHDTGFDTAFHLCWRDREYVQDVMEIISGNRVNHSMMTIGGVRRDITPEIKEKITPMMHEIRKRVLHHQDYLLKEKSFVVRQKGVALLSEVDARKFCTVGPTARGSNVAFDVRKADPHAAYEKMNFDIHVEPDCDIFATLKVRLAEAADSVNMVLQALNEMPVGDIKIVVPKKLPAGEGLSRSEAPRGEVVHYVRSNGGEKPDRHKIRAPTLANLPSLVHRLKGCQVADIPPVIRVIDPCIGCCERVTFINLNTGKEANLTEDQLISRANRAYRSGAKVLEF